MKLRSFFLSILTFSTISLWAYDFSSENADGITLYYDLVSSTECELTTNDINHPYKGDIVIPSSVVYNGKELSVCRIGDNSFNFAQQLSSVVIPESVTSIGERSFNASSIPSIYIPKSVTNIDKYAFNHCYELSSVTFTEGLIYISSNAFVNCDKLTSIVLPSSLLVIGNNAFGGCTSLNSVQVLAVVPPECFSGSFYKNGNNIIPCTLKVPSGSKEAYESSIGWKDFWEIIEFDPTVESELSKCSCPSISYSNGSLSLDCATEEVEYITEIIDSDVKIHHTSRIDLSATYTIKVIAKKTGYENSDPATATLCWLDSTPQFDNLTTINTTPVLIKSEGNTILIEGIDKYNRVEFYSISGSYLGAEPVYNGQSSFITNEDMVIVKIGSKSVTIKK